MNSKSLKYYRVYRVNTNETIEHIKATNEIKASYIIGKIYGENNKEVDFEEDDKLK